MAKRRKKISALRSPFHSNAVGGATFVIGAEAGNVIVVNVQLQDQNLEDLAVRGAVDWYIASDATGDTIAAATSGAITQGTDGQVLPTVAGRMGKAISEVDGDIDFSITDTAVRTIYLVIVLPDGSLVISEAITFA